MSQDHSLSDMDADALVDAAIEDRTLFKKIGMKLDAMNPNENASNKLISAFRHHRCEPWFTAYLLGCVGHPVGYETAKRILLSNARSSSESYAGVAMAKMLGIAAYDDLRKIVFGDYPLKVRQGAAYGMVNTSSSQLLDDLLLAFNEQRLSCKDVSWHAVKCNPTDDWLLELLDSDNVEHQKLACAIIELMVSPNSSQRIPDNRVASSVQRQLNKQSFSIIPSRRDNLLKWVNKT